MTLNEELEDFQLRTRTAALEIAFRLGSAENAEKLIEEAKKIEEYLLG